MSSGKKGKKKKFQTVNLNTFLADGGATPTVPVKPLSSWADDIEDEHEGFSSRSVKEPVILPTAPRAARGPRVADEDIPTNPPYVAYLSNLPYEVDEEYLTEFFADMKIANIRLPKDSNKLKGFGYVEFEDRQSLIDALCLSNTPMKTRRVRIDVSNSINDDRRGGRMGRDNRRDYSDDPERTSGDWRSGPRDEAPLPEGDSYRSRYDNRDRRSDREASDYDNKPGAWRESNDRVRSTFRDRGGFRDDDREREWSRYDKGSRDREEDRGSSFGPRRNYNNAEWDRDGPRKQERPAMDSKPEPRIRPKLNLQPRTKPIDPIVVKEEQLAAPAAPAPVAAAAPPAPTPAPAPAPASAPAPAPASAPANAPASSANIFGAAKPVDTTAREREIEERLAKSYAESKTREDGDPEKRAKDGTWGRRNGEGREEKEKERGRQTWRSEDSNSRRNERSAPQNQPAQSDQYGESRGHSSSRSGPPSSRGPQKSNDTRGADRERRDREKDDISKMPKAKDEQAPNFVASNKYSMLPDDVDPDNIDD